MSIQQDVFDQMNKDFQAFLEKKNSKGKIELPPKVFLDMQGEILEYERKKMLKVAFPILERYANPMGNMQGGVVAAAFDNTFGPLSFLIACRPVTTLDMNINYIRPIPINDRITITAKLIVRGFSTMNMSAECYNSKDRLMASATTNMLVLS
ncbi:MAG: PaaI family thioesterase [Leptospiraceae bacterium]|nr:PaaI family thioesterase [Leptospiraceae bacterium]MCP5496154.1 PaaI family thioesterase [Leptospiraceae bacterium]